jgi:hypothetical protein
VTDELVMNPLPETALPEGKNIVLLAQSSDIKCTRNPGKETIGVGCRV